MGVGEARGGLRNEYHGPLNGIRTTQRAAQPPNELRDRPVAKTASIKYNCPMLTKEEVLKLAKLSRIELSETEVEKFRKDLSTVLDYIDELKAVDVSGVGEVFEVTGLVNVQREDKPTVPTDELRQAIFSQAPEMKDGYYKVKAIL